jgi:hypothetical protein
MKCSLSNLVLFVLLTLAISGCRKKKDNICCDGGQEDKVIEVYNYPSFEPDYGYVGDAVVDGYTTICVPILQVSDSIYASGLVFSDTVVVSYSSYSLIVEQQDVIAGINENVAAGNVMWSYYNVREYDADNVYQYGHYNISCYGCPSPCENENSGPDNDTDTHTSGRPDGIDFSGMEIFIEDHPGTVDVNLNGQKEKMYRFTGYYTYQGNEYSEFLLVKPGSTANNIRGKINPSGTWVKVIGSKTFQLWDGGSINALYL